MLEWWTNRSRLPSSGVMKPKPFSSLNHLTVPVAIGSFPPGNISAATRRCPRRGLHLLVAPHQCARPFARESSTGSPFPIAPVHDPRCFLYDAVTPGEDLDRRERPLDAASSTDDGRPDGDPRPYCDPAAQIGRAHV